MSKGINVARINVLLATLGAIGGAAFAVPLTMVGKFAAQALPADAKNYLWNMAVFAVLGALFCPLITWTFLPRVPLWRAVAEPASGVILGALVGALVLPPFGLLLGAPVGGLLAGWRLHRQFGQGPIGDADAQLAQQSLDVPALH